jgi:hypothetical protein
VPECGARGPAGPAQGNSTEEKKMKSKISALGLALFAALAFGALSASAASAATDHISAPEPWTPTVSAATEQKFESTTDEGTGFSCEEVSATVTEDIPATADEFTATPFYSDCDAFEGGEVKAAAFVENGGCQYRFEGKTTTGNPTSDGEHATVHIERHEEQACHIQIKVTAFKLNCSSIPEQEVEHAVRYEQGNEDIVIKATAHGTESTTTNSIACPTETEETETHTNGSYEGDVTVKAHNETGKPVKLMLTDDGPRTHHITAPEPWTPTVSAATEQKFESTTDGGKGFSCEEASATVTEDIPSTADELTATPFYGDCVAFEGGETNAAAHVENGGCQYRFEGKTTAGNPTSDGEHATVHIENHTEPTQPCHIQIKVTAFKFNCFSVPDQEIEHAVRYDQGGDNDIEIVATAHGIESTTTNSIACPTETGGTEVHTNGSYEGTVTVKGHNEAKENVPLTLTKNAT